MHYAWDRARVRACWQAGSRQKGTAWKVSRTLEVDRFLGGGRIRPGLVTSKIKKKDFLSHRIL